MNNQNTSIKFSINNWEYLYSFKAAIERKQQAKGNTLTITGSIRSTTLTDHQDTPILIELINVHGIPDYQTNPSGEAILGILRHHNQRLHTQITIDDDVFEEFRKNLMEYADIDGIHIIVSIELEGKPNISTSQIMNILDVKYAMKGDT